MVAHVFWEDGEPFESDMLDQSLAGLTAARYDEEYAGKAANLRH